MEEYIAKFETSYDALKLISRAVDKYLEKWPGGNAEEQLLAQDIQFGLRKAMLEFSFKQDTLESND